MLLMASNILCLQRYLDKTTMSPCLTILLLITIILIIVTFSARFCVTPHPYCKQGRGTNARLPGNSLVILPGHNYKIQGGGAPTRDTATIVCILR